MEKTGGIVVPNFCGFDENALSREERMNAKHVELLRKLEQFQLDSPEASLPFSARLARENNWTPAYAQRVIAEYKRFAFLAVAAGHPVSPSEDVDQVWHLHLTYSENYWKVFCPEILGQPFHHHPTRGGEAESAKFDDWYARTLESYKAFFNEAPPVDIWPSPEERKKEKHLFTRVDSVRNWVIPKPQIRFNRAYAIWFGLTIITVCCSGAMLAQGVNVLDWRGPDFLAFYILFFPVCLALALGVRWMSRIPLAANQHGLPELDGYALAYLNGGEMLTVNTAIANLVNQNSIRVDKNKGRLTSVSPQEKLRHPLERVIYEAADWKDGRPVAHIRSLAAPATTAIAEDLKQRGLVLTDAARRMAVLIPLLVAAAGIAVGVIKIAVGLSRDKPVSYLVALCIIFSIISLLTLLRRPLRSRYGDKVLRELQENHAGPRQFGKQTAGVSMADFATMMGLFGFGALAGTELETLRRSLQPPSNSSGGWSSCGSSCGGGGGSCGGGGGCGGGGCGGCGGS